jgi:flagellar capping protein FliD
MPSPPVVGLGTTMETQQVIRQLLEVERRPLKRLEYDNERNTLLIKAWEEVRKRTRVLADKSQALYSFSGAFASKSIVSSDPAAVSGQAAPDMDNQEMQLEVLRLATYHRVHSAVIGHETEIPAGKFTLKSGERTIEIDFEGGKLPVLVRVLKAKAVGVIDINLIRKDSEKSIVVFRSLVSGDKGKLQFEGPAEGAMGKLGLPPGTGGGVEVEPATNALLKLHGVEVERPSNENLTDILDGASLTLRKVTTAPVSLRVQANQEQIEKQMNEFVAAYNDLVQFCRENAKTVPRDEFERNRPADDNDVGEGLRRLQAGAGVFAADNNIRQLLVSLQTVMAAGYPALRPGGYRVLADIGITTGGDANNYDKAQFGILKFDPEQLAKALRDNGPAVKEILASDTNEDAVIDNGAAFRIYQTLQPYNRMSGGIITSRIDLLKQQITDNKEKARRKESGLVSMEADLRRRFGRMESAIKEGRQMGQSLNGLNRGGQ